MNASIARFLAALIVVSLVLLVALHSSASSTTTAGEELNRSVDGPGHITYSTLNSSPHGAARENDEKKRDDIQNPFQSPSFDVCERLRRALRGNNNTTADFGEVYQQKKLLPSKSRLVFRILIPRVGVGLCNVRAYLLDNLVLAAIVGADVVLPDVHVLVKSCYFKQTNTTQRRKKSSTLSCFTKHSESIAKQLEGYFDVHHLRAEWKRFCPSMTLYHDRRSEGSRGPFLEELGSMAARQPFSEAIDVESTRSDQDAVENNVEKRINKIDTDIRRWLATQGRGGASAFVVNIRRFPIWDWSLPVVDASLGELRRAVGASLRSSQYIMRAAARVVEHLNALGEASGNGRRFCGAHLRSEPDIQHMASFANGTRLTDTYLEAVLAAGTKQCGLVYVAAGTKEHLDRFSALASAHNITLITMRSLIKSTTLLQETAGWSYSQKSVLEYEILAASHKFFGASVSSFSWNLAMRRYFARSTDTLPLHHIIRPLQSITYHDALSTLYFGTNRSHAIRSHEHRALQGMWP
ncbi:membrane-associated protein, putative [Bodo saltans]|uniref:Membrane-associated protein, putative n=1 Tax=Bodo saltans TaxID=75058 RepID=A0A0S4JIZ5_BODSA|nr:membrane-associated protein, putative [Bodo saltans]|eukprot:CUG88389.1 membrane-associated protein, putative [Bodo saltans]